MLSYQWFFLVHSSVSLFFIHVSANGTSESNERLQKRYTRVITYVHDALALLFTGRGIWNAL